MPTHSRLAYSRDQRDGQPCAQGDLDIEPGIGIDVAALNMSSYHSHNARHVVKKDKVARTPSDSQGSKPRIPSSVVGSRDGPTPHGTRLPPNGHQSRHSVSDWSTVVPGGYGDEETERNHVALWEHMARRSSSPVKPSGHGHAPSEKSRRSSKPKHSTMVVATTSASPQKSEQEDDIEAAWSPQASLVTHTTAPLACRVSVPPLAGTAPSHLQPPPLDQQPPEAQEAAILEDLLFVFMGLEGQYIRFRESYNPMLEKDRLTGPEFCILDGLDPTLRHLTTTVLRMATHYVAVDAFVQVHSRAEYGAVSHALCAAMRRYLEDHMELVAELENQLLTDPSLTLHVLHLRTREASHHFGQLHQTCQEIIHKDRTLEANMDDDLDDFDHVIASLRDGAELASEDDPSRKLCKGGGLLGLLSRRLASMSGDPSARALLTGLLRDASRPYMAMLNEWLHHGGIKDPHGEFLVREQRSIRRDRLEQDYTDEYWDKRYTTREHDIPPQLEGVKDKVLLAGKYLNVVRECGGVDITKVVQDVPRTFDDPQFLDNVNEAYAYANTSLLKLLLTTHALPARLRSMKHYFFLDRSDFFTHFMDLAATELKKPMRTVNVGKLQSLLDLVLRQPGSVAAQDPFKEDVKIQLNEIGLTRWLMRVVSVSGIDQEGRFGRRVELNQTPALSSTSGGEDERHSTGYQALELDYIVPFPLSLVIGRKTVLRYQLLFRYLLSLRHLESLLIGSWTEQTQVRNWRHKSSEPRFEVWKRRAWTLRARMLVFVQQLMYYCTAEVIEPNWQSLMASLGESGQTNLMTTTTTAPAAVKKGPCRTVDELMQDHVDFLDTCLKECMLTNSKLIKIHSKIMMTCNMFATYTAHLTKTIVTADPDLCAQPPPQYSTTTASGSSSSPPPPPSSSHSVTNIDPSSTSLHSPSKPSVPPPPPPSSSLRPSNNHSTTNSTSNPAPSTAPIYDPNRVDKISENLERYEENFSRHLRILLDALNYYAATETVVLLGLCARLSMASEGVMIPTLVNSARADDADDDDHPLGGGGGNNAMTTGSGGRGGRHGRAGSTTVTATTTAAASP